MKPCLLICALAATMMMAVMGADTEATGPLPTSAIEAAFAADGFKLALSTEFEGMRGFLAASKTAVNSYTHEPKYAVYVEGNAYQTGYLVGQLQEPQAAAMCTTFLEHLPLELVDDNVKAHWNETLVKELELLIDDVLGRSAVTLFHAAISQGDIPSRFLEEMEGLVAGALSANPNTEVTLERLISINYGFDVITARVFSGHLLGLSRQADKLGLSGIAQVLRDADAGHPLPANARGLLKPPAFCDAIGVRGPYTATGSGAYFGRAYQMVMGGIAQDLILPILYVPVGGAPGVQPMVSVTAPGMVGSFAGMNTAGSAMGVDTIRAANSNPERVGFNSLMLIRATLQETTDLASMVDYVADTRRGAAFLYPMCDGTGDCAVIEAGAWSDSPADPLQYVDPHLVRTGLLPDAAFLAAHPTDTDRNGAFIRLMNYSDTQQPYVDLNPPLFAHFGWPYNETQLTTPGEFMFVNWTNDDAGEKVMENNFFHPQMEYDPDIITVSNFAVIAQDRLAMMNRWSDLFSKSGESVNWRYAKLVSLLMEKKGDIDYQTAIWIMSFLSPDRTPGYFHNCYDPSDPMTAVVEGSLTVYDLQAKVVSSKSGYWCDDWISLHIAQYFPSSS